MLKRIIITIALISLLACLKLLFFSSAYPEYPNILNKEITYPDSDTKLTIIETKDSISKVVDFYALYMEKDQWNILRSTDDYKTVFYKKGDKYLLIIIGREERPITRISIREAPFDILNNHTQWIDQN